MKHMIALTGLVGWYLLTPPWVAMDTFDVKAPLTRWYQAASVDSAADCERSRSAKIADFQQKSQGQDSGDSVRAAALLKLYQEARCISTSDARLGDQ
jgi:hypothetical protein